ncbi:hypothetical protein LOD99_1516 [Oopsacas minuta]|uniref:Uncharacterized protein n=1 Tax=Oopsacas minuta TaxID=111878 RepID=A0AAV7K670_9METZ|nr:hypothetical protein LOD99_1516 [Oopsacas minuta]
MPNLFSAPRSTTGYHNDHSGVAVFHIPSGPQDIVHKWKRFLHRDDLHTMKNIFVYAKYFDSDDIVDKQTYLDIDGQMKTQSIKATLKKGAIPKYLPCCPDHLNDHTIKHPSLDRDQEDLQIQVCQVVSNI